MVFGNNTASDISTEIVQNTTSREAVNGIWKYYEPVLLPNTTNRSCYYLFIIEAETLSVTHKRPFILRLKKKHSRLLLRQWKEFVVKLVITIQGKQFNESNL